MEVSVNKELSILRKINNSSIFHDNPKDVSLDFIPIVINRGNNRIILIPSVNATIEASKIKYKSLYLYFDVISSIKLFAFDVYKFFFELIFI